MDKLILCFSGFKAKEDLVCICYLLNTRFNFLNKYILYCYRTLRNDCFFNEVQVFADQCCNGLCRFNGCVVFVLFVAHVLLAYVD